MSGIEIAMLAAAAASAAGTMAAGAMQAQGTIAQANAAHNIAKNERKQLGRMASEELAVATRGASEKDREMRMLQSRAQAVAADSGAGATDETVLELAGNVAREGSVQKRDILRTGQVKADDLMYRGTVGVANAKYGKKLARHAATGTLISAGADAAGQMAGAFAKYGGGGPAPVPGSDYGKTSWYDEPGYKYPRL